MTPRPARAAAVSLAGVSCVSVNHCIAAGSYEHGTVIERWNGRAWKIQRTPKNPNNEFYGVSCLSADNCIAVGRYWVNGTNRFMTLAERWNGRKWRTTPTPNPPGATATRLLSVSCSAPRACTAVGSSDATGTLAESWNGTRWTIQPTPSPDSVLLGVSCPSAKACTAVGFSSFDPSSAYSEAVAEHWNGKTWTVQKTPKSQRYSGDLLTAVSCSSARACTAIGNVVERWSAGKWTIQHKAPGSLTSIVCTSDHRCTAVGQSTTERPIAATWAG